MMSEPSELTDGDLKRMLQTCRDMERVVRSRMIMRRLFPARNDCYARRADADWMAWWLALKGRTMGCRN